MAITVITPPDPTKSPVAFSLLKQHLNIEVTESMYDEVLKMYLQTAVDEFEAHTGRALLTQTVKQTFDKFPNEDFFLLERAPYVSDVGNLFQYYNEAGVLTAIPSTDFLVDNNGRCPRIVLKSYKTWPAYVQASEYGGVALTYKVGYGDTDESIPLGIKHILLMIVGDSFIHREDTSILPGVGAVIVTWQSKKLMDKYKLKFYEHKSQKACQGE